MIRIMKRRGMELIGDDSGVAFALTVTVCWLLAYGLAKPLTLKLLAGAGERLQTNAAMVVGMGLYTVLNYLGQRFFAFKKSKPEETDDHVAD